MPRAQTGKDEAGAQSHEAGAASVVGDRLADAIAAKVLDQVDMEGLVYRLVESVASKVTPRTLESLSLDMLTDMLLERLVAELCSTKTE